MESLIGTGVLFKRRFITEFNPGTPGSPATAGTPSTQGYWATREKEVCVFYGGNPATALSALSALTGQSISPGATYLSGGRLCTTVTESYYVPPSAGTPPSPAVPATPDQVEYDYQLGWNARARSIPTMTHGGTFTFSVNPSTIGAMVGLTVTPAEQGYADMTHAFYVRRGSVSIYERGAEVQSVGSYPGATLGVRRYADKVQYTVNSTVVREVETAVLAPTWIAATLYSGGDSIESPVYQENNGGRIGGRIQGFEGYATDTDYCSLTPTLQAFTGFISIPVESVLTGELAAFTGYLGKDACIVGGELEPFSGGIAFADLVPTYGIIGGQIHPAIGTLNMLTGQLMTVDASFAPMVGILSDRPMGYIAGQLPAFTGGLVGFPEGEAYLVSDASVSGDILAATELVAFINSVGTITGLMSVEVWRSALMENQATIGFTVTTQAQIDALLQSVARSVSGLLPPDKTGDAWVFNQSAGGMTRYEGYDFNSFAEVGGHYYGAKSDGIYLLEGRDDDGTAVTSRVNFGSLSFGTINRKALPYVYVGMASSGDTYLKVVADGQTFTYKVRDNTELMKAHRFEPGRGLRASFYDVELIADGEVFDLESIDFQPIELNRRL